MLIQYTKNLMDELKIKPVMAKDENPLFCWHANLITVNHRKTVVLINYSYDFGDNWEHYIVVEEMHEDYSRNYPICIAGEGTTPPEDVGGESGYDEFLEAASDSKHPEYAAMLNWSKMQLYGEFNIESVNRRFKSALRRR